MHIRSAITIADFYFHFLEGPPWWFDYICSIKRVQLWVHKRSLNPRDCFAGNQRHICRQLHHTLLSVWSWCTSSWALNTGYCNIQTQRFPAESCFLFYKAWTYCITVVGIWNSIVSVGGLCCASKESWISCTLPSVVKYGVWLCELWSYLHSSAPLKQGWGGEPVNSLNHQNIMIWFPHNEKNHT